MTKCELCDTGAEVLAAGHRLCGAHLDTWLKSGLSLDPFLAAWGRAQPEPWPGLVTDRCSACGCALTPPSQRWVSRYICNGCDQIWTHGDPGSMLGDFCRQRWAETHPTRPPADSLGHGEHRDGQAPARNGECYSRGAGERGSDGQTETSQEATAPSARPAPVDSTKGGDADEPRRLPSPNVAARTTGQVAAAGTVHPEAAPKLVPCAECRAPLRPEQVRNGYCAYCVDRHDHGTIYRSDNRLPLAENIDIFIALDQEDPPRAPWDWDVAMLDYES